MIPKIEPMDAVSVPVPGRPSVRDALGAFVAVAISVKMVGVLKVRSVDVVKTVSIVVSRADMLYVGWTVKAVPLW